MRIDVHVHVTGAIYHHIILPSTLSAEEQTAAAQRLQDDADKVSRGADALNATAGRLNDTAPNP